MKEKWFLLATLLVCFSFFTFPLYAEPEWSFILLGDSQGSGVSDVNGVNVPILSEIVHRDVDFVLFLRNLVSGGVSQLLTWRETMQPVYDVGIGVYPVRGNHDVGDPVGTTAWNNVFGGACAVPKNGPSGEVGLTYSVSHKNVLVLAIDEYTQHLRVNQPWVNAQLAANTDAHAIAFGHTPAFQVWHNDCLDDYVIRRDIFLSSLKKAGLRSMHVGTIIFIIMQLLMIWMAIPITIFINTWLGRQEAR